MTTNDVIQGYGAAGAAGDMEALAATFHDDAVWHQPGRNQLSGGHRGPAAIVAHLGRVMEHSGGTFTRTPWADYAATTLTFPLGEGRLSRHEQHLRSRIERPA
jgi:ketosteroid isomerase-like protein